MPNQFDSFFAALAEHIQPDFDRDPSIGDFYNSPLQYFGQEVQACSPISTGFMRPVTTLETINETLTEQQLSESENIMGIIFLSECLLQTYRPEASLHPDLFSGIKSYLSLDLDKGDAHAVEKMTYLWLLEASLAYLWARYQQLGLPLPVVESEQPFWKHQITMDSMPTYVRLLDNYHALYAYYSQQNLIKRKLDLLLTNYQLTQRHQGGSIVLLKTLKKAGFSLSEIKAIKLSFIQPPWNPWFHVMKKNKIDDLDFTRNSMKYNLNHHPTYNTLFSTLLLIHLHEHLRDYLIHNNLPWIPDHTGGNMINKQQTPDNPPDWKQQKIQTLSTDDPSAPPQLSQQLKQSLNNSNGRPVRFVNTAYSLRPQTASASKPQTTPAFEPVDRDDWTAPASDSPLAKWTVTLKISEDKLEARAGLAMLLSIDVFYYNHQNRRTLIPCDLIEEYQQETDSGEVISCFKLALNALIIKALDFSPTATACIAGFDGTEGEGHMVMVFTAD